MGKKGSTLVPFLVDGLKKKKYGRHLTGSMDNIIELILPRKTKNLSGEEMKILKDWNQKKGRKFKDEKDYTKAKQGMLAALRRSVYLKRIQHLRPKLCYRILNSEEVKEEKRKIKVKVIPADEIQSPSSVESGFESSVESPMTTDSLEEIEVEIVSDCDSIFYDSGADSPPDLNHSQIYENTFVESILDTSTTGHMFPSKIVLDAIKHDHDDYSFNAVQNQNAITPTNKIPPDPEILDIHENELVGLLSDPDYNRLLDDVSSCDKSFFDDFLNKLEAYNVRLLKFKSEYPLGEKMLLICEEVEKLQLCKTVYDLIPLDGETTLRLKPYEVAEVKEDENNVFLLFSDLDLIVLDNDTSKRLKLSQIAEVKRSDHHVLFFSKSSRVYWE